MLRANSSLSLRIGANTFLGEDAISRAIQRFWVSQNCFHLGRKGLWVRSLGGKRVWLVSGWSHPLNMTFFFLIFDQGKDGTSGWVGGLTLWETTLRPIEQSIAHDGSALDRGLMQKWFQITIYQLDINQGSELLLKLQPSAGHKSPCCLSCLVKSKLLQLSSYRSWNKTTLANIKLHYKIY